MANGSKRLFLLVIVAITFHSLRSIPLATFPLPVEAAQGIGWAGHPKNTTVTPAGPDVTIMYQHYQILAT
jgi:hypothetical protein